MEWLVSGLCVIESSADNLLSGILRKFLVYPTFAIYPQVIPTVQLFDVSCLVLLIDRHPVNVYEKGPSSRTTSRGTEETYEVLLVRVYRHLHLGMVPRKCHCRHTCLKSEAVLFWCRNISLRVSYVLPLPMPPHLPFQ